MAKRDDDPIDVTEANFGALLIEGLKEARSVARGELRARRVGRTLRTTVVAEPENYPPMAVRDIRNKLGVSQGVFAKLLNASSETVKAWEQGRRAPDGMARTLLEIADRHPAVLLERMRGSAENRPSQP
jgi:putative transcriptional regulator